MLALIAVFACTALAQSSVTQATRSTSTVKVLIMVCGALLVLACLAAFIWFKRTQKRDIHHTRGYGPDLFAIGSDTVDEVAIDTNYHQF